METSANETEPKVTGVQPLQTSAQDALTVLPPEHVEKKATLSSALDLNYQRGMTQASVPLAIYAAQQYEVLNATLTRERDDGRKELSDLRERETTDRATIATLNERIRNFPNLSITVSALQILGGGSMGAGLGNLVATQQPAAPHPAAWVALLLGLLMIVVSLVVQYRASHPDK